MTMISPACIPQLHPVAITDWITKLGEKAFLSWLRFHCWKNESASSSEQHYLPLSLNKIIKRLKIGKTTFYEKVLQPLLKYGFIQLHPTQDKRQEIHLIIYEYPANCPKNAAKVLEPLSSPEEISTNFDDRHPSNEDIHQETPKADMPIPPSEDPLKEQKDFPISSNSLPTEIQQTIQGDQRLQERMTGIIQAYENCCTHPSFSISDFKQKMLICLNYCQDKQRFGPYLYKALLNEWKKPASPPNSLPKPPRTRPHDVPEWVWRQQESPPKSNPTDEDEIDPELKAEIEDLLRQLGEIE